MWNYVYLSQKPDRAMLNIVRKYRSTPVRDSQNDQTL